MNEVAPVRRLFPSIAPLLFFGASVACSKGTTEETKPEPTAAASVAAAATAAKPSPAPSPKTAGEPLRIAYSDWPGWVAWDIGVQKGWFKEEGVNVEFKWFEYAPSMEAYSAGKVDAVTMTNGDALVTASSGAPSVAIVINDFSNGNDMIVAKPGIKSMADLKGKKIGVEVGFVDHLLLMYALKSAQMTDKDVQLVNLPTDQTPQALKSGQVDAIAAWQPNSGAALREVPGSTPIYTSANVPGLIYDVLAVNPKSLREHHDDWLKVTKVWLKIAIFVKDDKNVDEAAKIMSARVSLTPDAYKKLMGGTAYQDIEGNVQHFKKADGLESIYGSGKIVDDFNVKNSVYKASMKVDEYLDPSFIELISKEKT